MRMRTPEEMIEELSRLGFIEGILSYGMLALIVGAVLWLLFEAVKIVTDNSFSLKILFKEVGKLVLVAVLSIIAFFVVVGVPGIIIYAIVELIKFL